MNRLSNRQSGNDMLHADSRIAIPIFAACGFSEGSYAGSKGHDPKKGASDEAVVAKTSGRWPVFLFCDRGVRSLTEATPAVAARHHVPRIFPKTAAVCTRTRRADQGAGGARGGVNRWSERWLISWQSQARG